MLFEHDVVFFSQGTPLAGRLLRNTDDEALPQPVVNVSGSWLTVKEQMPLLYARRLAEAGFTAFVWDFAGFGQSGGEIRQFEQPQRKIADIRAAADFVRGFSFAQGQKVAHLAVCASAQYTLRALAGGAALDAFVSVAGWYHDAASVSPFYGGAQGVATRLARADAAARVWAEQREVVAVPAYQAGNEQAAMFFELDYYANPARGAIAAWQNEMAEMSWRHWLTFDGLSAAAKVSTPTLIFHSDGAVLPDNARAVYARLRGPRDLVWSQGNQVDFYDLPDHVDRAMAALQPWLEQQLRP